MIKQYLNLFPRLPFAEFLTKEKQGMTEGTQTQFIEFLKVIN